jgi:hypothetical protein
VEAQFAYTKHQTPRGARADAHVREKLYLLKNVSRLRLTYQIRLLAYMAHQSQKKLVIRVPKKAVIDRSLAAFVRDFHSWVSDRAGR